MLRVKAILFGLAVAIVGVALDIGMARAVHRFWTAELVGNALTGAAAGYALLRYMAHRVALSKQRADQIAYLNHHIRNAMEAIVSSHYTGDDRQRLAIVRECCQNITEALRRFTHEDNVSLDTFQREPSADNDESALPPTSRR